MNYNSQEEYDQAMGNEASYMAEMEASQPQLSTTSILALFDTNKEQRESFISGVMAEMESGNIDPLKIHYQIKCIEKIIDEMTNTDEKKNKNAQIAKRYKALVLDAAEKYGSKEFDFKFSKIKIGETGVKYDYSKCNDPMILDLIEEESRIKEAIKERTKFLQGITKPVGVLIGDIEDGEMVTIYPPAKTSTTSVILTLKL